MDETACGKAWLDVARWGYERFSKRQNLPDLPDFGIMEIGEVWKGPIMASMVSLENGPSHCPRASSLPMTCLKASMAVGLSSLFGGEKVCAIVGIPMKKPDCIDLMSVGYFTVRLNLASSCFQVSARKGESDCELLPIWAVFSTMMCAGTARATVFFGMLAASATIAALPLCAGFQAGM